MRTHRFILALAAATAVGSAGCDRQDGVRTYSAPKDPAPMQVASGSQSEGNGEIHFTTPPEWKPLGATGMSVATYRVAENPPLDVTVTPLPATAGEVLPNVNRWRKQLGLSETTEAEVGKDLTAVKVGGADAQIVDLMGPDPAPDGKPRQRMLAAIVPLGGKVWFFKLSGAADRVGPQREKFDAMVKSAHIDAAGGAGEVAQAPDHAGLPLANSADALPPGHPPVGAQPGSGQPAAAEEKVAIEGIASYTLPEGWRVDPAPRAMRAATIVVGSGGEVADLAVTRLGANFGDKLANINRWRGQVGLGPVKDAGEAAGQEVSTAQGPMTIYDFAGPEGAAGRKRVIVAMSQFPKADSVWFFRLLGPHDVVAKNKPAFEGFVRSLKFAEK